MEGSSILFELYKCTKRLTIQTGNCTIFNEWELPTGATAEMFQGEPTISSPQELSGQLNRIYARFVWSKEIPGHLNPGAPERGAERLYQFAAK